MAYTKLKLDLLCGYFIKSTFNTTVLKALDEQIFKIKTKVFRRITTQWKLIA